MAHISQVHKHDDVLCDADIEYMLSSTNSTVAQQHEAAQLTKRQALTATPTMDMRAKCDICGMWDRTVSLYGYERRAKARADAVKAHITEVFVNTSPVSHSSSLTLGLLRHHFTPDDHDVVWE